MINIKLNYFCSIGILETIRVFAQSAGEGAVEYTDCFSAEE